MSEANYLPVMEGEESKEETLASVVNLLSSGGTRPECPLEVRRGLVLKLRKMWTGAKSKGVKKLEKLNLRRKIINRQLKSELKFWKKSCKEGKTIKEIERDYVEELERMRELQNYTAMEVGVQTEKPTILEMEIKEEVDSPELDPLEEIKVPNESGSEMQRAADEKTEMDTTDKGRISFWEGGRNESGFISVHEGHSKVTDDDPFTEEESWTRVDGEIRIVLFGPIEDDEDKEEMGNHLSKSRQFEELGVTRENDYSTRPGSPEMTPFSNARRSHRQRLPREAYPWDPATLKAMSKCTKKSRASSTSKPKKNSNEDKKPSQLPPSYIVPATLQVLKEIEDKLKNEEQSRSQHPCKICNTKFKTSGALNGHLRVHIGERLFTCKTCGKEFKRAGNLARHIMKTHLKRENRSSDLTSAGQDL